MPLSFVIARYFAYAFAAVATAWLASFMALSAAINAGFVYEASWGPANVREGAEGLARVGMGLFLIAFAPTIVTPAWAALKAAGGGVAGPNVTKP